MNQPSSSHRIDASDSFSLSRISPLVLMMMLLASLSLNISSNAKTPGTRRPLCQSEHLEPIAPLDAPPMFSGPPPGTPSSLSGELTYLYGRYAKELADMRVLAKDFCSTPKPEGWPHTDKCLSTIFEMEILYMRIREEKPANVLEIASAIGYTTMYLLAALGKNGAGVLYSFDVFETPFPYVLDASLKQHWKFTHGNVYETFARVSAGVDFQIILMDADHTREFGAFYRDTVLIPALARLQTLADETGTVKRIDMTVHDVYHFEWNWDVTAEGEVHLAWLGVELPLHTMSCYTTNIFKSPRRATMVKAIQRAALGAADEIEFGYMPRGDLSVRCAHIAEPLPQAESFPGMTPPSR